METPSSMRAKLNAISATDWSSAPVNVQCLLLSLIERVEEQDRQITALQAENTVPGCCAIDPAWLDSASPVSNMIASCHWTA